MNSSRNQRHQQSDSDRILSHLNTAVLCFAPDSTLSHINLSGEFLLGYSVSQAQGKPAVALLGESVGQTLLHVLDSLQSTTLHDAALIDHLGKPFKADITITALNDGQSETCLLVEIVQTDNRLRMTRESELLERLETNRMMMRGLAHEIKNPLGGLRGASQLLERQLPDASLKEYTDIIIHEADRLKALVDRIMGPSKPLDRIAVNPHRLIEHVISLLNAEQHPDLVIRRDFDPSLPPINGDRDQLIQALLNVTRNAVQAMQQSGTLTIRTRIERGLNLAGQKYRNTVRVDIEDDGPGLDPALGNRIFDPLVSGHAQGAGLGLPISQDIVNRHGGLIEVNSKPGYTCFTIYLPIGAPRPA